MNIAAFIAKRIAFNQQKSFSRFVIRLSISATVISVAIMIITLAFTSGFQQTISDKVFSFWGHIRIHNYEAARVSIAEETPILKTDSVAGLAKRYPEIVTIQAYATKNAILKTSESIEGVLFKGVEPGYDFKNIDQFLVRGRWVDFTDSAYSSEINLSAYTAAQLKLEVNDKALIYFVQPGGAAPRPRKLTVVGIYKTGIEEYDKMIAIGDIRLIQRLNNWRPDQVGGYEIFLKDYRQMERLSEDMLEHIPLDLKSSAIVEIYPNIFDWLALQNKTIVIVLIIMIIIATLNLVTCLLIMALERTKMVGTLKALGARNFVIQKIFLYHGGIITLAGLFFGNLLGLLVCLLQRRYGFISLPEEAYYISKAAVNIEWGQVALVNLFTFIICLLCLTIPTLIVRKMQPVKAMQFR
ncbi:MAG: ABC transporter permease [Chitinophagaceae bacterium]|nr:ABC transporter permease [Chitinophagaceae bacterium]